jgi:hypothetical protein
MALPWITVICKGTFLPFAKKDESSYAMCVIFGTMIGLLLYIHLITESLSWKAHRYNGDGILDKEMDDFVKLGLIIGLCYWAITTIVSAISYGTHLLKKKRMRRLDTHHANSN